MKKKLQLVLLSTDKATNLILDKGKLEFISNKQVANTINSACKGFHLYAVNDEKIKEGDYFIELDLYGTRSSYTNKVYKCDIGVTDNFILTKEINFPFPENCRKVVITNDNHISLNLGLEKWKAPTNKNYDIVYTRLSPYPTFTNDFLDTYIKKYNDGKMIKEIEVEYKSMSIGFDGTDELNYLKVNPDNTVDVSLVGDKLYTKEEVIKFAEKYAQKFNIDFKKVGEIEYNSEDLDWIKQNL